MSKSIKPRKIHRLKTVADAKRFVATVCEPRADRIIEGYGVLQLFGDQPECDPFDEVSEMVRDDADAQAAINRLLADEATRPAGRVLDSALTSAELVQFEAGYLLGLTVGKRLGGAR